MFEKKPDELKRIGAALYDNPVWRNLAKSVGKVIEQMVHEPRWALSRIRSAEIMQRGDWVDTPLGRGKISIIRRARTDVDNNTNTYAFEDKIEVDLGSGGVITLPTKVLHDRQTLIQGSRLMGFDFYADDLQDDDYARVFSYVGKFWQESSGESFVDFLGFIKRMRFSMDSLWESDSGHPGEPSGVYSPASETDKYKDLTTYSQVLNPVWKSQEFDFSLNQDQGLLNFYYPTSHVALNYDILNHPKIDEVGVMSLFYLLAPIHLVLERFVGTIYSKTNTYLGVEPQFQTIQQGVAIFDNTAKCKIIHTQTCQLSTNQQAVSHIPISALA
jgi:hypothetical protein